MWSIIISAVILVLIGLFSEEWVPAIIIGIILFLFMITIVALTVPTNVEYFEKPVEFQEVEGKILFPQNGNYIFKYNDKIRESSQKMFLMVQSDSIYEEIRYKRQVRDREAVQNWLPGHWDNDTTVSRYKYILYRNFNSK